MPRLPFGTWPSPVGASALVGGAVSAIDVGLCGDVTWWSQSRPAEQGRVAVVRRDPDGTLSEVLPDGWSARTRVHEYGGGAWWVARTGPAAGAVFVACWADQRLYRVDPPVDGGHPAPVPLTPEPGVAHGLRYADGRVSPDGRWVVCVRERHLDDAGAPLAEAVNELVAVPTGVGGEPGATVLLAGGSDFVASPRLSPDGRTLVWVAWDHPAMPWDATRLVAATLDTTGTPVLRDVRVLAGAPLGDPAAEALMQPDFTPDGRLLVVSDRRDGWWALHEVDPSAGLTALHRDDHEVGGPAWVFGGASWAATDDGVVRLTYGTDRGAMLRRIDAAASTVSGVGVLGLSALRASGDRVVAIASSAEHGTEVVELVDGAPPRVLDPAHGVRLDPAGISRAEAISYGSTGGRVAHALYYPPTGLLDGDPVTGLDGERPPVVVHVHGGPTAAARASFSVGTQFWTSRGFAVLDVDYGGSTGYGRAYRRVLDGAWGVVDVEDVVAGVRALVDRGLADPARTAISGGSAGGFTVLAALVASDVFAAGADYYGVADLAALASDTHKFESRYLDGLLGPYPAAADVYTARSPLTHADAIRAPLLVLQGLEDAVVPPAQSEAIVAALVRNRVPHAYLTFEGEQHGFRRAETIVAATQAELAFYGRVFGFWPAGVDVDALEVRFAERLAGSARPR